MTSRVGLACFTLAALLGCERLLPRHEIHELRALPYPSCGTTPMPPGELLHEGNLRAGPFMRDKSVVEHYSVRRRACLTFLQVRQEWPLGTADVEVIYDAALQPVRVWKRMTLPADSLPLEHAEITLFELRMFPVGMKRRNTDGHVDFAELRGQKPGALVGPGRGILSLWIRRENLAVGGRSHDAVLDFRGPPKIDESALVRNQDRYLEDLGKKVRVYTFYGRESVYTDDEGWVIGDLQGLRPSESLTSAPPPPIPTYAPLDPVGTP